jgi:hypothetical protein
MDSKYYFIQDFENLYLEYMKNNDILVWKNKPNEPSYIMKQYCKMDLVLKYNMYINISKIHNDFISKDKRVQ